MIHTARQAEYPLRGTVRVPGDKSVSHRAVIFAAMSEGTSHLTGVLDSEDVRSTIGAVSALGASVTLSAGAHGGLDVIVEGWGADGPRSPAVPVDCGNSGTTSRLLLGVIAGWPIRVTLTGDESLSRRPMRRVTEPLSSMGARFQTSDGCLPVTVEGGDLRGIAYEMPVASAQVKSAVLLAGTRAHGRTSVTEPSPSRDHTELLLPAFGVPVGREALTCWVDGPVTPRATDVSVPADPSSAAFLAGAALMVPGSRMKLVDVTVNPTRIAFAHVLRRMGGDVAVEVTRMEGSEPVGTIEAAHGPGLHGTTVSEDEVPSLIDEIPLLAVVATAAEGVTRFEGIGELRVKESDRLDAIVAGITTLGGLARSGSDWLEVEGPVRLRGGSLDSRGDHRFSMAWAVAGLTAVDPVVIDGFEAVAVSYPGFTADLDAALDRER